MSQKGEMIIIINKIFRNADTVGKLILVQTNGKSSSNYFRCPFDVCMQFAKQKNITPIWGVITN